MSDSYFLFQVFGNSQAYCVIYDLSLDECGDFIVKWSEELECLRLKYRNHLDKISSAERFRRSLGCLNIREHQIKKLTEAQKDFHWFIHILKSLPNSSVCQERCAKAELLNLYRQWKKGHLISMLPIMDFILKTLLKEKVY
ncbi:Transcription regulator protein BACH1 [Labeo rohita]|uniref:Transcription regulator protein BACH1 n=1 Tax=Labeo rohita TaxID=84645 RepID=A0ABQ8MCV5_LABRO|nr:Transcription regulator protein BACH1 [Labeo rohita]